MSIKFQNYPIEIPHEVLQVNLFPKIYKTQGLKDYPLARDTFIPIISDNPNTQKYIVNGFTMLYGFNQLEACNNFIMAGLYDPQCALAFWGASYSVQLNINHMTIPKPIMKFSIECLKHALTLRKLPSTYPVVNRLIKALYSRCIIEGKDIDDKINISPPYHLVEKMMEAYHDKMFKLYKDYPDDPNIGVLYVSSVMTIKPWKWWPQGSIYDIEFQVMKHLESHDMYNVLSVLTRILSLYPEHLGALHFLIHAVEESPRPQLALGAAQILTKLQPRLGHLVHMPSHIYSRLGMYQLSINANIAAVKVDNEYIDYKRATLQGNQLNSFYIKEYYAHNIHFLIVDSVRMGNISYCLEYLPILENHVHKYIDIDTHQNTYLEHFLTVRGLVYLRFEMYQDVLHLTRPSSKYKLWIASDSFVRVCSLCKLKQFNKAKQEFKRFQQYNKTFIHQAPKETCRCGCQKRHGGISNPHYGMNKYAHFRKLHSSHSDSNSDSNSSSSSSSNSDSSHSDSNGSSQQHELRCCALEKHGNSGDHIARVGGIRNPDTFKPKVVTGTLTINNSQWIAYIREDICRAHLAYEKDIEKSLSYLKKGVEAYESLQYDEPSDFFYSVHETYAAVLYGHHNYKESLKVAIRGGIPYPNNIRLVYLEMLNYKQLHDDYNYEMVKHKYIHLKKLSDFKITLDGI
jgi:hypothetical protein